LRLCLQTVFAQTVLPDEIVIGDDGSADDTRKTITELAEISPVPIVHVWQPDEGFRLAAIRNKSFAKAKGDYIIQIDGDLLLHKKFVQDHLQWARPGTFISGARSLLSENFTNHILQTQQLAIPGIFSKELSKKYNALHIYPLTAFNYVFQRGKNNYKYVLGANMAFWKKDLQTVNGYDETFSGWGKEDNELAIRLINAGVAIRFLKFAGIIRHLYHKEAARDKMAANERRLENTIANNLTFASVGLDKYL
jgi:glycosyltransferase involved in cell wall biosynthesis